MTKPYSVAFKQKMVQEIAFSTRQPEEVKRIIIKRRPDTFS